MIAWLWVLWDYNHPRVLGGPPGHCADNGLKHTPCLIVKKAYLVALESKPEGPDSSLAQLEAYRSPCREQKVSLLYLTVSRYSFFRWGGFDGILRRIKPPLGLGQSSGEFS